MSLNSKTLLFEQDVSLVDDYLSLAEKLKGLLQERNYVILSGDLAAGKTTFVQKFCELYHLHDVSSRTFAIHQTYKNEQIEIDHLDLYRLQSAEEVETSGLWDLFSKDKGLVFIEWPERISIEDLPLNWQGFEIEIKKVDEKRRKFKLSRLFS